jgi:PAS domain S-box-containing protein
LDSKLLKNNQNKQPADPRSLEAGRDGFWISAKTLSIVAMLLGFFAIVSWYLNSPALKQVYPDWIPAQLDILLGIVLIVMGAFLALVVGLAFNAWRKGESLQNKLDDERGLRKKVERDLDRAQEISRTGTWVLELLDQKMWWSNEGCRILGWGSNNIDMNFRMLLKSVYPDDRDFVNQEIQKTLTQGTAINLTHRIVRRDGSIRMVKQRSEIYLDQKGNPTQVRGTLQDITDQKEAENLAAGLGRIVDKSFNEIYIFDADNFKFTKVNLAARLNLRYNMEELNEMTPVNLLSEFTQEQFEELADSLKKGVDSITAFETVHKRNNGSFYPVDVRLQYSRTETRPQFIAIVQDITDRKKVESLFNRTQEDLGRRVHERTSELTELNKSLQIETERQQKKIEALEEGEQRLTEIIDNVVDGIITIDEEGTIHSYNRAAEYLFGVKAEEALGKNIKILMGGSDDASQDEYLKDLLQSKKSAALGLRRVITARKKDGTPFSAELTVNESIIRDQRMYTGLLRNLTEKGEVEYDLWQTLKRTANS